MRMTRTNLLKLYLALTVLCVFASSGVAYSHTKSGYDTRIRTVAGMIDSILQAQYHRLHAQIMVEVPIKSAPVAQAETLLPASTLIHLPAIAQNPELYDGCEVTSLAMMLSAAQHPVGKMKLADMVAKDPAPLVTDDDGGIISWGDPNMGFVGDITGANRGFGVYHGPIRDLVDEILPGQAVDLTGKPLDELLQSVAAGRPVMVWTNVNFVPVSSWITWQSENGPVRMTWQEHAVLLVGYDDGQVYINDPFDGTAAKAIDREPFIASWKQMGSQAVSYKP